MVKTAAHHLTMTPPQQSADLLNAAILTWTQELAPHGIFTTDHDLRITSWNRWLENHSSLRAQQVLGRPLFDIVPTLLERRLNDYFNDALRGEVKVLSRALHGYLVPFPPPIEDTDFSHMQQSARIAPLVLEGKVCGTITVIEDVTEREWQASTLRASEERFRVMADTVPDIIYTADAGGRFDFLNHRFYEFSGLPPRTGLGSTWMDILHPDDSERVKAAWQQSIETGAAFTAEFRMRNHENHYRWVISRAWPISDHTQRITRWMGASTDIHDLKDTQFALAKAETELKSHAATLEDTVAERTAKLRETITHLESFSYTVAHDLRAPIRAMESYSRILLEDLGPGLGDEPRKMITNIGRAARHLDALTRDILSYTKVSTKDVQLQPVEVENIVQDITSMNPALQSPNCIIAIVRPITPVLAHTTLMTQCLSNLLDNAVKFVPPAVVPRIVIRCEPAAEGNVRLWIEDNGIGMDEDTQRKIFGIFERARGSSAYPGTGIGLAIVAKAIERMGGTYGVQSELGKGSRFWIELPAAS
jgi:PAS domain S-box-containing protein